MWNFLAKCLEVAAFTAVAIVTTKVVEELLKSQEPEEE